MHDLRSEVDVTVSLAKFCDLLSISDFERICHDSFKHCSAILNLPANVGRSVVPTIGDVGRWVLRPLLESMYVET